MKVGARNLGWILLLLALLVGVTLNSMYIESWVVGLPLSIAFFFVVSTVVGKVFFLQEKRFFRVALGFAAFFALTALFGSVLIISAQFSKFFSLVFVGVTGLVFGVLSLRIKGADEERSLGPKPTEKPRGRMPLYLASAGFLVCVAVAFCALAVARTGEGITSVWLTIPGYFLPVFFLCSLILMFILFFTRKNVGLKLSLIFIYSFLARSLFWIVWYPGRYGDPWQHLGNSRFIDRTGMPYAYSWMLQKSLVLDLVKSKAQYAPLILIARMFNVDIYWVHTLFVPFFWSFLVPLFSYKFAEMLAKGRSERFPLVTALVAGLFPSLVLWGTVSVSNSVGFILFFFVVFLMFYWVRTGERQALVLSLLVIGATLFAHMLPAIFALMFFLMVVIFQKFSRAIEKVVFYLLLFLLYPLALYMFAAQFSLGGFFAWESFGSLQSDIIVVTAFFGLLGLVFSLRSRYVERRNLLLVFAFYGMIVFEYYLSEYGMSNLPYGARRVLVIADFLFLPFVALGVIEVVNVLARVFSYVKPSASFLKKVNFRFLPRSAGFALICLVLSAQASLTLYQAYPHQEINDIQPAVYMMEAIYHINSTAPGPYVVLCGTQLANIAIGLLGIDYGYGGGRYGLFGMPVYTFPTMVLYSRMGQSPSVSIMQEAIDFTEWAKVAYFVLEVKSDERSKTLLKEISAILDVDAVFGDGKLYVFKYHRRELPFVTGVGPIVKVTFEDGNWSEVETSFRYMYQSDVDYWVSLSGHSSYNITDYPRHWAFSSLSVDGELEQFDESSDVNEFIYVSRMETTSELNVTWKANDFYPNVGWKEDSFKSIGIDWHKHPTYGNIKPNITSDGNVLEMSWDFVQGVYPDDYQIYYYNKTANISTNDYNHTIVRWRSTGPVATVVVYFESGSKVIVPYSSYSLKWTTTIVVLPPEKNITSVMVGLTNLEDMKIAGSYSLEVDYILIAG